MGTFVCTYTLTKIDIVSAFLESCTHSGSYWLTSASIYIAYTDFNGSRIVIFELQLALRIYSVRRVYIVHKALSIFRMRNIHMCSKRSTQRKSTQDC